MELIFKKETEEYLLELGIKQEEINKLKFDKLKLLALRRLNEIIHLISIDDYIEVRKFTCRSGDDYNDGKDFINFGDIIYGEEPEESMDILDLCSMLQTLQESCQ